MKDNVLELFDSNKKLILEDPLSKKRKFQIDMHVAEI